MTRMNQLARLLCPLWELNESFTSISPLFSKLQNSGLHVPFTPAHFSMFCKPSGCCKLLSRKTI